MSVHELKRSPAADARITENNVLPAARNLAALRRQEPQVASVRVPL
ncbi:hypothetical protein [Pseudomonas chlororaphis]|nr:hypothetical protein [Pseudomonas chlororaphis]